MVVMKLVDAIFSVAQAGEDAVICAKEPYAWGTEAVILPMTSDHRIPEEAKRAGFSYFLGRDDVLDLLGMISRKVASRRTQAEFVSHYAIFDAYPSWFEDLRDA
jgi:hypothetical protein